MGGVKGADTHIVKVKGVNEVRHVFSAPCGYLGCAGVGDALRFEPGFDEHDLGVVVSVFGEYATASGPGRNDVKGETIA